MNELEDERRLYDEKIGRSIQIIDNLKGWKEKWEAAGEDKKNEMLRLMTVKISTFWHKDTIDGKGYEWKDLQIIWNEEFSDLFELGIFEKDKKKGSRNPGHGGSLFQFNSQKIRDGLSDIGRFSLPEPNFEGIRHSRTRGLFEHGMINRFGLRIAEGNLVKKTDKRAEFRRTEKFDEGMAWLSYLITVLGMLPTGIWKCFRVWV